MFTSFYYGDLPYLNYWPPHRRKGYISFKSYSNYAFKVHFKNIVLAIRYTLFSHRNLYIYISYYIHHPAYKCPDDVYPFASSSVGEYRSERRKGHFTKFQEDCLPHTSPSDRVSWERLNMTTSQPRNQPGNQVFPRTFQDPLSEMEYHEYRGRC